MSGLTEASRASLGRLLGEPTARGQGKATASQPYHTLLLLLPPTLLPSLSRRPPPPSPRRHRVLHCAGGSSSGGACPAVSPPPQRCQECRQRRRRPRKSSWRQWLRRSGPWWLGGEASSCCSPISSSSSGSCSRLHHHSCSSRGRSWLLCPTRSPQAVRSQPHQSPVMRPVATESLRGRPAWMMRSQGEHLGVGPGCWTWVRDLGLGPRVWNQDENEALEVLTDPPLLAHPIPLISILQVETLPQSWRHPVTSLHSVPPNSCPSPYRNLLLHPPSPTPRLPLKLFSQHHCSSLPRSHTSHIYSLAPYRYTPPLPHLPHLPHLTNILFCPQQERSAPPIPPTPSTPPHPYSFPTRWYMLPLVHTSNTSHISPLQVHAAQELGYADISVLQAA